MDTLSPTVAFIRASKEQPFGPLIVGKVPANGPLTTDEVKAIGEPLVSAIAAKEQASRDYMTALNSFLDAFKAAHPGKEPSLDDYSASELLRDALANEHAASEHYARVRMALRLEEQTDPAIRAWWMACPLRNLYLG